MNMSTVTTWDEIRLTADHPSSSLVAGAWATALNSAWDDEQRQLLKPYTDRLPGSATGPADEETRAWLLIDWMVRVHTPALLRLTGLDEHARALESLERIADPPSARAALASLEEAHKASFPDAFAGLANDATRIAAWAATGDAAGIADWAADAPWDAWRAASWIAARVAARTAAAEDAAWDALVLLDAMIEVGRRTHSPAGSTSRPRR